MMYLVDFGLQEHEALFHALLVGLLVQCVLYLLDLEVHVLEVVLALHVRQVVVEPQLQLVLDLRHVFLG